MPPATTVSSDVQGWLSAGVEEGQFLEQAPVPPPISGPKSHSDQARSRSLCLLRHHGGRNGEGTEVVAGGPFSLFGMHRETVTC